MRFGFYLPAAGKILLTALRRSPYDGIGSFLLLLFPHQNKLLFVPKDIEADTAARCFMRAGRMDGRFFLGLKSWNSFRIVRQAEHRQKESGPA